MENAEQRGIEPSRYISNEGLEEGVPEPASLGCGDVHERLRRFRRVRGRVTSPRSRRRNPQWIARDPSRATCIRSELAIGPSTCKQRYRSCHCISVDVLVSDRAVEGPGARGLPDPQLPGTAVVGDARIRELPPSLKRHRIGTIDLDLIGGRVR